MTPQELRNEKMGKTVVEALKRRHFDAYYVATKEEAKELALTLIPEGDTVSWGGCMSCVEIGLTDALHAGNYTVLDRDKVPAEERMETMRKALLCDTFITGTNALSADGQLVNIDGNGNRVAAMTFGPKSVVVIAGVNKITPDLETAMKRARCEAAPLNTQRFPGLKTPCTATGCCGDCIGTDSICAYIVTTRVCRPAGKIKVIIVGETLGL